MKRKRFILLLSDIEGIKKRLLSKCTIFEGHWLWNGATSKLGYGVMRIGDNSYLVHRLSRYVFNALGIHDPKFCALHNNDCHIRHCFNPEHLHGGTQTDNMIDHMNNMRSQLNFGCGHLRTEENTQLIVGNPHCKWCNVESSAKYRIKQLLIKENLNVINT